MRLKKCQRIRLQSDFDRLKNGGVFRNASGFFCKLKENPQNILPRFAVIVGKKVGKAYERNTIKRLFREIFRQEQKRLDPKRDYLIVARKGIIPDFYGLKENFLSMCTNSPKLFLSIAIDGTAASGKSSVAHILAKKYRLLNINTGDHYRTLTFFLLQKEIARSDFGQIGNLVSKFSLNTQIDGISAHMTVDGITISREDLRSEILNKNVSIFAQIPQIRQKLRTYEQSLVDLAQKFSFAGIVMEGRDIGTHVIPNSNVKIFLTADPKVRQNRRQNDGEKDVIAKRDLLDYCVKGSAIAIDTTAHTLEQVIEMIEKNIPSEFAIS